MEFARQIHRICPYLHKCVEIARGNRESGFYNVYYRKAEGEEMKE